EHATQPALASLAQLHRQRRWALAGPSTGLRLVGAQLAGERVLEPDAPEADQPLAEKHGAAADGTSGLRVVVANLDHGDVRWAHPTWARPPPSVPQEIRRCGGLRGFSNPSAVPGCGASLQWLSCARSCGLRGRSELCLGDDHADRWPAKAASGASPLHGGGR